MYILLTILIVLASILLILVVVIQNSKGGGLAAGFASSNQIMGVRKTTDFLEKATWYLVATVVVLSIVSTHFLSSAIETKESKTIQSIEKAAQKEQQQQLPAAQPIQIPGNEPAAAPEAPAE